ncbi:MAG: UPF0182 family protein, partial [Geobacteraceae bacterium]|nr:UPF0182 family protein [Geobacteraceae bacterium]
MLKNRFILILIIVSVIFPLLSYLLSFYTDWLFFVETGFSSVFATTVYSQTIAGVGFAVLFFAFALINLRVAGRATFPYAGLFIEAGSFRFHRGESQRFVRPLSLLACAALALSAGQWGAVRWEELLLFINRITVGTVDPVIGKDLGFYLFSLPFLEMLKAFAGFLLLSTAVMTAVVYYVRGGIALTERGATVDGKVRRHLAVLAGLFACVIAAGFYLDGFRLLYSNNNAFYGAGYVDVNSRL